MAQSRAAQNLAEFVKLNTIGAAVFGKIISKGQNGNGAFVVMSPAGFRASGGERFGRFQELAVGLSTDLASKVNDGDVGKLMLFVFVATKKTAKSPMKIFNVWELTGDEARRLLETNTMPAEWSATPEQGAGDSEDDDLPF